MRNPHTQHIMQIALQFIEQLERAVPECKVDLGGSLRSDTMLPGHQDIDLKVLVPQGQDSEEGIRRVSAAIANIVPFQKVRPYGGQEETETFAVIHQLKIADEVAGEIEVEVLVVPARVYVGYAKFQSQLPQWMLDAFVAAKWAALQARDKAAYKRVKNEFYAMTRALYRDGYFDQDEHPETVQ